MLIDIVAAHPRAGFQLDLEFKHGLWRSRFECELMDEPGDPQHHRPERNEQF